VERMVRETRTELVEILNTGTETAWEKWWCYKGRNE
jgi:hypothetical protein